MSQFRFVLTTANPHDNRFILADKSVFELQTYYATHAEEAELAGVDIDVYTDIIRI